MAGPSKRSVVPSHRVLALMLVTVLLLFGHLSARAQSVTQFRVAAFGGTVVRNGGKCLDYVPGAGGSAIFLNDCAVAHPIEVQELQLSDGEGRPLRNRVHLRAGNKVIGVRRPRPSVRDAGLAVALAIGERPLELQTPAGGFPFFNSNLADQTFVLDGDSIILASQRHMVVKVQNARGRTGTPIVLGFREVASYEFWEFRSTDGVDRDPTSAFIRVSGLDELAQYLGPDPPVTAHDGTVFKVVEAPIILSALTPPAAAAVVFPTLTVPAGVTVRSDRRGTRLGAELAMATGFEGVMLYLEGNNTRVSGLRLRGPGVGADSEQPGSIGIRARDDRVAIVDQIEAQQWTSAGVEVLGGPTLNQRTLSCPSPPHWPAKIGNVRIMRSFLHDNKMDGLGYGVVIGSDGTGTITGNTFVRNRHAIAGDGTALSGYAAMANLVLSSVLSYGWVPEHDFDMHGYTADPHDHHHYGGTGGNYVDIAWNTFLGGDRINYALRGAPCLVNVFHNNVTERDRDDAIYIHYHPTPNFSMPDNRFGDSSPPYVSPAGHGRRLGVGDFDGDGRQDLFLATGTAWYFSAGGRAEWRLLNAGKTDTIESLLFGDFDGDGRTDVVGKSGSHLMVSWGGVSEWERLNSIRAPISDLAVGDFDGDGRSDIFYGTGHSWFIAYGGDGPFLPVSTSGFRVRDLAFGDFDGDGHTDVLGVVTGAWRVSYSALSEWRLLNQRLTSPVHDLIIADLDGNGHDDVVSWNTGDLAVSLDGQSAWFGVRVPSLPPAAVGRFRGERSADLLMWFGSMLRIATYREPDEAINHTYSRADMR